MTARERSQKARALVATIADLEAGATVAEKVGLVNQAAAYRRRATMLREELNAVTRLPEAPKEA